MTFKNDDVERTEIIGMLFGAYGQSNDGQRQAIYSKMLEDIPTPILRKAVKKIILENKFVPAISEIVEAAKSLVAEVDESKRVKPWHEAWAEIQTQMHDAFVYKKPVFSTPEIEAAVNSFGWIALCTSLEKDMPIVRAQVRQFYENACKRKAEADMNGYVLGTKPEGFIQAGDILIRLAAGQRKQGHQVRPWPNRDNVPKLGNCY